MERYIDANKIDFRMDWTMDDGDILVALRDIKKCIDMTPTADVVPRSEVIDEILSWIDDRIRYEVEIANSFISARHSKSLWQERINALKDLKLIINNPYRSEIKKKYKEDP